MTTTVEDFQARHHAVLERINQAATQAGRNPQDIRLIAVSKTFPTATVMEAYQAGMTVLGENRPQELAEKAQAFLERDLTNVRWCQIGHLQRNKAKEIARYAHEFHALDSLRLAHALQQRLVEHDRYLGVFIQVNTSNEPQKGGFSPQAVETILPELATLDRLRVTGLMTMAVFSDDESVVRPCFSRLRELRDALVPTAPEEISLAELSMGMTGDFEWAIAEGATCVRIGTALFGHRAHSAYLEASKSSTEQNGPEKSGQGLA